MIQSNEQKRLARIEAMTEKLRSEMDDVLKVAYDKAVESGDEDSAAELARRIRNNLLSKSDKECAFDRILPDAPSGTSFTDWISWLKSLAAIRSEAWGAYRQSLRDLTKQSGFPFSIDWPVAPKQDGESNDE